jgi:hypothetical protein
MKDNIAFIDGDLLLYKACFVNQVNSVHLTCVDGSKLEYKTMTEAISALDITKQEYHDMSPEQVVTPKPFSYACSTISTMIDNITRKAKCSSYRVYIDGEGNFRKGLATIQEYKSGRASKPYHYADLKGYLIKHKGAIEIVDIEADDAISIATYSGFKRGLNWVGCTTDKDAKGTAGKLLNWDTMTKPVFISEVEANRWFYKQLLMGDKVDTIAGARGVGEKSPHVLAIDNLVSQLDMYNHVLNVYKNIADSKGEVVVGEGTLTPEKELEENAHLLYMFRHRAKYDSNGNVVLQWSIPVE